MDCWKCITDVFRERRFFSFRRKIIISLIEENTNIIIFLSFFPCIIHFLRKLEAKFDDFFQSSSDVYLQKKKGIDESHIF